MMELDMNMGGGSELLRSTGKNPKKRNVFDLFYADAQKCAEPFINAANASEWGQTA